MGMAVMTIVVTTKMIVMMPAKKTGMVTRSESNNLKAGVSLNVARAFLVYGALVTGPVTHYFYILLDRLVTSCLLDL